ncbi:hypothetical protein [Vagococcus xieshaowenii]|uniref:Uncharacterized protein n=1 Tax=Vagococcus xieshaowenii TaxID=2562451 RepID=A0AAJ5EGY9_9ENTE|nr:hypothetical protein [Vagococcus xieshaowenii]QCA28497.1 hypothetical protein E4Z98_03895 [Vagococcus xieshaowenii]TFZ42748.1 hypothetical protein E4031_01845 [Vagococcus xieshaowenii]
MTELLGVLIGAFIAIIAVKISIRQFLSEIDRREEIKNKMKEIDILVLLNKKINEVLQKRDIEIKESALLSDYERAVKFDDVKISIDDFIYIQSFCAQNHYYLPTFLVEEFFKNIAQRKVVLDPKVIRSEGAYVYQSGREIFEKFSDQLNEMIEDRKIELKQITNKYRR